MRTIIFSTTEKALDVKKLFGGKIFGNYNSYVSDLISHLETDENAIAIIIGDTMLMGWSVATPAQILFTIDYPTDEKTRVQARGRIRPGVPNDTVVIL